MADDIVTVMNRKSGQVLEQSADDSINAVDWQLDDPAHKWFRVPLSDGFFAYKNVRTGNVLDHWYAKPGAGNVVAKNGDCGHPNHQWYEMQLGDVFIALKNRKSNCVLDHYYCREVRVAPVGDAPNEERHWCLIRHRDIRDERVRVVVLKNVRSGKALTHGGGILDALDDRADKAANQWQRIPVGQGYFVYKNVASGMVLSHGRDGVVAVDGDTSSATHQWFECDIGDGLISLKNRQSHLVLDHYYSNCIRATDKSIKGVTNFWKLVPIAEVAVVPTPEPEVEHPPWFIAPSNIGRAAHALAQGGFGTVYRATWAHIEVVVKEIYVEKMRRFLREVTTWRELTHDNVVPFYGANHRVEPLFIVSKFASNGDLIPYLEREKRQGRNVVWRKLKEVAAGLAYLHGKRIVHGDLKGNNIVVGGNGTAMLTDFGLSFSESGSCSIRNRGDTLGAMAWRAPEFAMMETEPLTFKSDVYSLGMCIIEAVTGHRPWVGLTDEQIRDYLHRGEILVAQPHELTGDQWALVQRMIRFSPDDRPGLDEVVAALKEFAAAEIAAECPY